MKNKKVVLSILVCLIVQNIYAESIISSGAIVYHHENYSMLLSLNGGVQVSCGNKKDMYYPVMVWVGCLQSDIIDDYFLKQGKKIFDTTGTYIGYTLNRIYMDRRTCIRGDSIFFEMSGLIGVNSIVLGSIPEYSLEKILNKQRKEWSFDHLEEFMKAFHFEDGEGSGKFTSKKIDESDYKYLVPIPRIILVFYGQKLAGVIYSREIGLKYYESLAISQPYKIYYLIKMDDDEKAQMAAYYLPTRKKKN